MNKLALLIIPIVLIIGIGVVVLLRPKINSMPSEKISFTTSDGVRLVSFYWEATGDRAVILAHQFARDKSSWGDLPEKLRQAGFSVLALDLRGHGESDLNYHNLTPADFNKMTLDIAAARAFLNEKGKTKQYLVGASIGANLALLEKALGFFDKVVAVSPGLVFKGLNAEAAAQVIAGKDIAERSILLIAARDDGYSFSSNETLRQILGNKAETLEYQTGGHAADLLANQPVAKDAIIQFLKK